ncbi:AAEL000887-PA [Aedes aegypti]|uniref:AAEL000887-PA n=1 Tax=Aedes aegypti TaxID=7159 RepID=Q17MS6_AEDAE|nr:AAEL000887-PA [Aedes aegypti]
MLLRLTILACLAISSATAEPHLEHAAAYGYGAHLFGGINPELYTSARAMAPVQYASSVPMVYANQLMASPLHRAIKPAVVSAPLQYAASLPVSYAAPQASLAYSSPYASHPHAHLAYGVQTPLTASYAAAAAAPSTQFHTPTQYASYAAAPVQSGHAAFLGSASAATPSSLNYAAALANAQAYGASSAYAQLQRQHQQQQQQQHHQQSHYPFQQQFHHQQQQQQQSYQQQLDAAFGRSAAELYGRGVPFAYSGEQVASSSAGSEIARQMAVQLSAGYHQQQAASAYGDARAQARTDSE